MKIPDDVFLNRCRWCRHGSTKNGNNEIPDEDIYKPRYRDLMPCQIMGISKPCEIPGECRSFTPRFMYGLCNTCEYSTPYGENFCRRPQRPNERQLFIGNSFASGTSEPDYWGKRMLSTCDAYEPNPYWYDIMRRDAAADLIPRNFDPDTMAPIEDAPAIAAAAWELIDQQRAAMLEAQEKAEQARRLAADPNGGQLSIFD